MSFFSSTPAAVRSRPSGFAPDRFAIPILMALAIGLVHILGSAPARAQSTAFKLAIAEAAARDKDIAAFYKARAYAPIWTGGRDRQRRRALLDALKHAPDHGLPEGRYDFTTVRQSFSGFKSARARGQLEVKTTRLFLQYATDIQSGILEPRRIDKNMTLRPPRRDRLQLLQAFAQSDPRGFIRALPPQTPDYRRLLKEKARMERIVGRGGWGRIVRARALKPGSSGAAVMGLRQRLAAMGYGTRLGANSYDQSLVNAVAQFQRDAGLNADGIAGATTLAAINTPASTRLMQVVIGLERLRWLNKPLGARHIIVNEAAFSATIVDNGKTTFETRVVVGQPGRWRTPEFEKKMTHMIINPSWYVPTSIAGKEYLPLLKKNPNALTRQDMVMTDSSGQEINPTQLDFNAYTETNFPFSLRQKPSGGNALGKVKFLFPNKHAIYLHDTPSKSLFGRDIRTFSHGCVRVQKPFELAYALLSKQTAQPKKLFNDILATGEETRVNLKTPVPIYLVYRTAWVSADGRAHYRADSYKVDNKVYAALRKAGVVLRGQRS